MTISERLEVDKRAYKLREDLKITTPIDFKKLVETSLGGKLKKVNNIEGISDSKIERRYNHFVILINESKDEYRQRFSIAHEISHLIIDMGYNIDSKSFNSVDSDMSFNREGRTEEEFIANEFTAALLMPKY